MIKKAVIAIIAILLSGVIAVCGYMVISDTQEESETIKEYEEMRGLAQFPENIQEIPTNEPLPLMDFTALREKNEEIIGWIKLDETMIDYPIVQGSNNSYYLSRSAEKRSSKSGAIFLDYRAEKDFSNFSSVIYGHNMKAGTMFGGLIKFKEKTYFDEHKTGYLYTPEKTYQLQIISVAITQPDSEYYRYAFSSEAEKIQHIEMMKETALHWQEDEVLSSEDKILILSTCSYERKNARTVLVVKLVD